MSQNDTYNSNIGAPLVILIVLFIVNIEVFAINYLEPLIELFKMYLFFVFAVISVDYFKQKFQLKKAFTLKINAYKNAVLPFLLVFVFLISNFFASNTIFETNMKCNKHYYKNLKTFYIPFSFYKFYEIDMEEKRKYFRSNYIMNVKINQSVFGYVFLKDREFKQLK